MNVKDKQVFLSGPMTGYDNLNSKAFNEAADKVRAQGAKSVYNPCVLIPEYEAGKISIQECRRWDMTNLLMCDMIVLLPGWQLSSGALMESDVARACGIEVCELGG